MKNLICEKILKLHIAFIVKYLLKEQEPRHELHYSKIGGGGVKALEFRHRVMADQC